MDEAQDYLKGRIKMVAKRFREPGDTENEIKKMESKRKRNAKKQLEEEKAHANAKNNEYLLNEMSKINSNITDKKKETSEIQSDVLTSSKSISAGIFHDLTESLGFDIRDDDVMNTDILEIGDKVVNSHEMHLESVNTINMGPTVHQSDLPSSSELSACSSYEEYAQAVINGLPIQIIEIDETDKGDGESEFLLESNTALESVEMNGVEHIVHQLDRPYLPELSACSSYEEYVQTVINGLPIQIIEIDETEPVNEKHAFKSNTVLESVELNGEEPSVHQLYRSSPSERSIKRGPVCYPSNSQNDECGSITSVVVDGSNIVTVNYDSLTKENKELKQENQKLKEELEDANKRNRLLQKYLVAADERVSQTLYIERDGGRQYRGGVFLNKNQCAVLDNSKSDREFLNNLVTSIFGKTALETSSITGAPSNRMKSKNVEGSSSVSVNSNNSGGKLKLDSDRLQLAYDIMDARSLTNKTPPLPKTVKNVIIGKKCTNAAATAELTAAKKKI